MTQKTYSYDEAYEATLEYFGGDQLAAKVWTTKYALKDADGKRMKLFAKGVDPDTGAEAVGG